MENIEITSANDDSAEMKRVLLTDTSSTVPSLDSEKNDSTTSETPSNFIVEVQTCQHGKTLENDIQNTKIDETKSRRRLSQSIAECIGDVVEQTMASDNMIVDGSELTMLVYPLRTSSRKVNNNNNNS